jgi:glycogen synthase
MRCIGEVIVPFNGGKIPVKIYRYEDKLSWYFLHPVDKRFFAGKNHPYDVTKENLVRDSLFFGAATARALKVIHPGTYWNLLMQDWEAGTIALALANQGKGCRLFLALHNSYDSGAITGNMLRSVGINPDDCPGGSSAATVLERALSMTEWPIFTVSEQYAQDLTEDILQADIMAPHLRDRLKPRLLGVNNGPFISLAVSDAILNSAASGNLNPLIAWKKAKRKKFLRVIKNFRPSRKKPVWGNRRKFKMDDLPWFVMAGRDDPRQKGYDVAASAIYDFLKQGGVARFLLFPLPGDEGIKGVNFLKELSQQFPENVLVFPFRLEEGYFDGLQGATYGIMPSLYEPFGMANEFYLNGTVGIARATGGLLQQIVPLQKASSFAQAVRKKAERWHDASAQPTGILYREKENIPSTIENWRLINTTEYRNKRKSNRLKQRQMLPLFGSMADGLLLSIKDGARIYQEERDLYYKMLMQGIDHIQRSFSWEQATSKYLETFFSWERAAFEHVSDSG